MKAGLVLVLFLTLAFTLATRLAGWQEGSAMARTRGGSALAALLGDSRRMFANQAFTKADAYFHSGYYPSIFDNNEAYQSSHVAGNAGAVADENTGGEHTFMGEPLDWIDRFSRQFIPHEHTHLDEGGGGGACAHEGCDHEHHEGHDTHEGEADGDKAGQAGEMLPWVKLAVELDPQHVESYLTASYWLSERMGQPDQAEAFLREGLMANPDSCELLFELGRVAMDVRKDAARARHLWETGLKKWELVEGAKPEPDHFMRRQLLAYLASAEEQAGDLARAEAYLREADAAPGGKGLYDLRLERLREKRDEVVR